MLKVVVFRSTAFLVLLLCLVAIACKKEEKQERDYRNVLVITIDTLRSDYVGSYGSNKVKTPNIDSLAASGIRFDNTVAPTPFTLPSHVSIFTGLIPPAHGVHSNGGFYLANDVQTLAEIFKAAGMKTAAFVSSFSVESRFGLDQGFDLYDDFFSGKQNQIIVPERKGDEVTRRALNWLEANRANPWFVWVHYFDPHFPYEPPPPFSQQYASDPYAGEVAYSDNEVGRLLSFLKEKNLTDQTLVVLTSDHGESLGEHQEKTHGIFAYESTLRVPLIIAPAEAQTVRTRVRLIDLAPTILALRRMNVPSNMQGKSLLQLKQGRGEDSYFEAMGMHYDSGWAPLRGFYSGNFKYIELPIPELYDLVRDSQEARNRCDGNEKECVEWRARFERYATSFPSRGTTAAIDSETAEQLQALGYTGGRSVAAAKETYTAEDDPKNLIGFHDQVYLAMTMHRNGDLQGAEDLLNQVITQRPDFSGAYVNLSYIQNESGHPDAAANTMKKGISNGVSGPAILGKLGLYLIEAGKAGEAIPHLKSALELEPQNPDYWSYLAIAYNATGDRDNAKKSLQQALSIDDKNLEALNNLAALYLFEKDFVRAEETYLRVLSADGSNLAAFAGIGSAYAGQKKWTEAIHAWNRVLERQRNYGVMLKLAFAYVEIKETEKALPLLREFEKNAPREQYSNVLPDIRYLIERLQSGGV